MAAELRLIGKRVLLRPPTHRDVEAFQRVFADPEVMRYVAWGRPFERVEVEEMLERMMARLAVDGFGQLALVRRGTDVVIGRAGLLPLDPATWRSGSWSELGPSAEIEIGWTLARESWGRGYATEAAVLVRGLAWRELGLTRLVSIIQIGNERSVRLAERLGGRVEREIMTSFGKRAQLFAYARPHGD
jgi:RimJ/RimL family protein N-acetyltransferase